MCAPDADAEPLCAQKEDKMENFDEIINFIYDNKKDDLKLITFTHADHENQFFKNKILS